MTDAFKWGKEYQEGRDAAQRGEHGKTDPYYSFDCSNDDMKRSFWWCRGWWDVMYTKMGEQAA